MLALLLLVAAQTQGPDPGVIDMPKEQAAILAAAKEKASKAVSYKAQYSMVESDGAKDSSIGSEGTCTLRVTPADPKKKVPASWQIALDDQGQMGLEATKFQASLTPKRYLILWPAAKEGEEIDAAKDKKLRFWPLVASSLGDLLKDHDVKLVRLSNKYALAKTSKSSQGGDTNAEDETKRTAKPSFDGYRSHLFQVTPKNAGTAAACKRILLCIDMDLFVVTRVEFDWKGDGSIKNSFSLKELDVDAKIDDAVFALDTAGYKVTKK